MVYGRSLAIGGGMLAIVILLSAIIFYLSLGPCPEGTFECDGGRQCVPQRQVCDNRPDCVDGSDEDPVDCGLLYGSKELTNKLVGNALKRLEKQQGYRKPFVEEILPPATTEGAFTGNFLEMEMMETDLSGVNNNLEDITDEQEQEEQENNNQNLENENESEKIQQEEFDILFLPPTTMTRHADEDEGFWNVSLENTNEFVDTSVGDTDGVGINNNNNYNDNGTQPDGKNCTISTYPRRCLCRRRSILYCGPAAQLTQIPPTLGGEVTNLIINRNNLTLKGGAFAHLPLLQRLTLKNANIMSMPVGVFNGLSALERLDIRHNNFSSLPVGVLAPLSALQWLFLIANRLKEFPMAAHLHHLPKLEWLMLSGNLLTLRGASGRFPSAPRLYEIYLDSNRIETVGRNTFDRLTNLHLLDLSWNSITYIDPRAFWGLRNIRDIRLIGNPLKELSGEAFLKNDHLEALSLAETPLHINAELMRPLNVSYLNLTGIKFEDIDFEVINTIQNLQYVIFDRFYYCSMTPRLRVCKPSTDGVSSFRDLLSKPVLRYSAWIMAGMTLSGNLLVLWGRFIYRDENIAVTMVIRNLALADILMGFYLLTISVMDYRHRNEYYRVALDWITSWQCAAAGSLAVISSEVSKLILAFMSLERFLLIADPFRGHLRIGLKNIFLALLGIWCAGVSIAVAPVILLHSSTKFYGTYSGTCFPLHIQEAYPIGWQYSAFIFLGVNLCLLLLIAFLYTALLISIWRTRKATPLSLLDCEFAVRFFFIVLTDVLCWVPIIVMKIWVFFNYNISDDIYAWLVVFILPLNSAVNPLLYTFTTPKYRNQILLRGWKKITARRRAEPSNGMNATTTATATGSSNPDDHSSGRAIALVASH